MNFGIVTIHKANNYGAVFQSTALGFYLKKHGTVKYINNSNDDFLTEQLELIRFSPSLKGCLRALKDILRLKNRKKILFKFNQHFKEFYDEISINDHEELNKFDIVFSGSDQIWNPQCTNGNDDINSYYFLDFLDNVKKVSYASSAGSYSYSEPQLCQIQNYLKKFKHVGVREKELEEKLALIDIDAKTVVDPTLLLSREQWLSQIQDSNWVKPKFKYIFTYIINNNKETNNIIEDYAKRNNLKIISLTQEVFPNHHADLYLKDAGPSDFLNYLGHSDFVFTDSFHGCCFSLIFEKQFAVIHPGNKVNRISNLFNLVNIPISNILNNKKDTIEKVNYDMVNISLEKLRDQSIKFIDKSIYD